MPGLLPTKITIWMHQSSAKFRQMCLTLRVRSRVWGEQHFAQQCCYPTAIPVFALFSIIMKFENWAIQPIVLILSISKNKAC
eukprot:2736739-Pleurochrysis_carterae.AAC.1